VATQRDRDPAGALADHCCGHDGATGRGRRGRHHLRRRGHRRLRIPAGAPSSGPGLLRAGAVALRPVPRPGAGVPARQRHPAHRHRPQLRGAREAGGGGSDPDRVELLPRTGDRGGEGDPGGVRRAAERCPGGEVRSRAV
ncbi:MAG: hypothetical protein AVDCRST_MAG47-595, partial [uncultured Nocardioidaceae bacterium]